MEDVQKIRAKSVVNNKFWILQQNNIKVGQIKARSDSDIEVRIHGNTAARFTSLQDMRECGKFEFTELPNISTDVPTEVEGFPTNGFAYNAVWNMEYKLPLYSQTEESKSWFAAGYYKINISGTWIVQYCPKLIALQRNEFKGPFKRDPGLNQFSTIFE